jgi:hypothetical protein
LAGVYEDTKTEYSDEDRGLKCLLCGEILIFHWYNALVCDGISILKRIYTAGVFE